MTFLSYTFLPGFKKHTSPCKCLLSKLSRKMVIYVTKDYYCCISQLALPVFKRQGLPWEDQGKHSQVFPGI